MEIYFLYILSISNFILLLFLFFYFNQFSDVNRLLKIYDSKLKDFHKDLDTFYSYVKSCNGKFDEKYNNFLKSLATLKKPSNVSKNDNVLIKSHKKDCEIKTTDSHSKLNKIVSDSDFQHKNLSLNKESLGFIQNLLEANFNPMEQKPPKLLSKLATKEITQNERISSMLFLENRQNEISDLNKQIISKITKFLETGESDSEISQKMNLSLEAVHLFKMIISNRNAIK